MNFKRQTTNNEQLTTNKVAFTRIGRPAVRKRKRSFTLIELLVVIAIIMILVSMVIVAVGAIKRAANRRRAATEMAGIANAIKAYNVEYGKWPGQMQGSADLTYYLPAGSGTGGQALDQAKIITALTNNPRDNIYIELPPRSMNAQGQFIDPWKRPYIITMDENKSGTVDIWCKIPDIDGKSVPEVKFVGANGVKGKIAVVSLGEDPTDDDLSKRVYSWKAIYFKDN